VAGVVGLGAGVHGPRRTSNGAALVTEVEVRAMLHRASGYSPSFVPGRFMVETTHHEKPWIIIVEPDSDERALVIVTAYESGR
jgi:lipocalin